MAVQWKFLWGGFLGVSFHMNIILTDNLGDMDLKNQNFMDFGLKILVDRMIGDQKIHSVDSG